MAWRKKFARLDRAFVTAVACSFAIVLGCGGQSMRRSDAEGDGGSSGDGSSSGAGGSSFAGTSGTSGAGRSGGCYYEGGYYAYGESFPAGDGCNTCICELDGVVGCTLLECRRSCPWNGLSVEHGRTFPRLGGCEMCTCDNGKITCVSVPCPETRCDVLWSWYSERVSFSAKQCDPSIVDVLQCTNLVSSSLPCGCVTYVQDADELDAWRDEWEQLDCNSPTPCVPCPPPPRGAFCSREGTCLDVY